MLKHLYSGKVRELYQTDGGLLLLVAPRLRRHDAETAAFRPWPLPKCQKQVKFREKKPCLELEICVLAGPPY